jgi:hypothetical protein
MKATELIDQLQELIKEHGDLPVVCHNPSNWFELKDIVIKQPHLIKTINGDYFLVR